MLETTAEVVCGRCGEDQGERDGVQYVGSIALGSFMCTKEGRGEMTSEGWKCFGNTRGIEVEESGLGSSEAPGPGCCCGGSELTP